MDEVKSYSFHHRNQTEKNLYSISPSFPHRIPARHHPPDKLILLRIRDNQ